MIAVIVITNFMKFEEKVELLITNAPFDRSGDVISDPTNFKLQ